ncbi:exopolysaccharide biosynthesis protein [Azospirillum halopraeferens]|uniref:exopolysaccharide biosynthesis protein n=1 Tax=Azospirillum halopraeferens TaxID=34010 RepID=UPI00040DAF82|nr:exopolysaccharide biosynthesis protein [Azospirillum halopraeferens]
MADGEPQDEPRSLEDVLIRVRDTEAGDPVSVADIADSIGRRSFGPLLLVPGVIMLSPLSGIPTFPTLCATLVLLVAGQMLLGRQRLWLPRLVAARSVDRDRLKRAMGFLLPAARVADRLFRPRLTALVQGRTALIVPALCVLLALTVPFLEVLPFLASVIGAAVTLLALALVARDGLLVVLALLLTGGALAFGVSWWG